MKRRDFFRGAGALLAAPVIAPASRLILPPPLYGVVAERFTFDDLPGTGLARSFAQTKWNVAADVLSRVIDG